MPIDVQFHMPFVAPPPQPGAVDRARQRAVDWPIGHGLLTPTGAAVEYFRAMRLEDVPTGFCPDVDGADLDVMTDFITWTAICDDFFDGPAGDVPAFAAAVVAALIDVAEDDQRHAAPTGSEDLVAATADLWNRMREPMSATWQARARHGWARFLRSFLDEADARRAVTLPDEAGYLALRRETMAVYVYLDAAERAGRFEVPERFLATQEVRRLVEVTIDILAFFNDVHSVEHEEARGDTHNLVLILEREKGLTRDEAIEHIRNRVAALSEEFLRIADGTTALCDRLSCDRAERDSVRRYVQIITNIARVTYDWSLATVRYAGQAAAGRRPEYLATAGRTQ